MTLLGVPDAAAVKFNVGTSAAPSMNMSLDDMIASRRKEQVKAKRGGGRGRVAAADRSLGAGRAKRDAAVAARRGIRQSSGGKKPKPSAMEIEREVYRQSRQTAQSQARALNRASRGRISANAAATPAAAPAVDGATNRRTRRPRRTTLAPRRRRGAAAGATTTIATNATTSVVMPNPRPPSKKAVNAAVTAMQDAGFQVPQGMQMLITFAPTGSTTIAAPAPTIPAATNVVTPAPNTPRRGRGRRGGKPAPTA